MLSLNMATSWTNSSLSCGGRRREPSRRESDVVRLPASPHEKFYVFTQLQMCFIQE
ncbi:unnamed protein product [Chondrus crispus]|uniref:Uncharacterized protein n=1 Tax=Chondrus crispus TaxID=2769 RepID=R7Q5G1_CHOCR|nr:unnamed protein product [Chondrus crispus]CDF32606.1 unnamed protein product [Chondrus crispus]|eukprot:XP_005712377.1 unnamed protein product [Chondrus crispus]